MGSETSVGRDFAALLGYAVIRWNEAEMAVRHLLGSIAAGSMVQMNPRGAIFTAEMGSRQVQETLRSLALYEFVSPVRESIEQITEYYGRLIAYRNYYFHGIHNITPRSETEDNAAFISGMTAKGKINLLFAVISCDDLVTFNDRCTELRWMASGIMAHLYVERDEPLPLPDMCPLPPALVKPQNILQAR